PPCIPFRKPVSEPLARLVAEDFGADRPVPVSRIASQPSCSTRQRSATLRRAALAHPPFRRFHKPRVLQPFGHESLDEYRTPPNRKRRLPLILSTQKTEPV